MSSRNIIVIGATFNTRSLNSIQQEYINVVKNFKPNAHWGCQMSIISDELLSWVSYCINPYVELSHRNPKHVAAQVITDITGMDRFSPDVCDSYLTENWIQDYQNNYPTIVEDNDGNATLRIVAHCSNSGWLEISVFYMLFKDLLSSQLITNIGYVLLDSADDVITSDDNLVHQFVVSDKRISTNPVNIDKLQLIECLTGDPSLFTKFSDFDF